MDALLVTLGYRVACVSACVLAIGFAYLIASMTAIRHGRVVFHDAQNPFVGRMMIFSFVMLIAGMLIEAVGLDDMYRWSIIAIVGICLFVFGLFVAQSRP